MDTEDGRLFVKHLAYYVRTHEKALADSLLSQHQQRRHSASVSTLTNTSNPWRPLPQNTAGHDRPSTSGGLLSALPVGRHSTSTKAPRLFLTPNQLYYLLVRFEELGVNTGPLNIRVENLQNEPNSSNYMSFLAHAHSPSVRDTDADSIHSVVSVRSTMSTMSSLWSHFSLSGSAAARAEKQDAISREDIRYLYSAFTKVPCLKLSVDSRFRRINGYEEFPFDTAIPIYAFKNLTEFEVSDIDFRSVYGWDRLADQLRVLVVKRASLDDLADLLTKIVLDDMDRRRRKSSKTPSTPISAIPSRNPFRRSGDWSHSLGTSDFPSPDKRPVSSGASRSPKRSTGDLTKSTARSQMRNTSPQQTGEIQQRSFFTQAKPPTTNRRASNSSTSSPTTGTPRQSSTNLSMYATLPPFKWRFLRHLSISDNGFTSLPAEALSPIANTLQSLDLSSNLFTEVPDSLSALSALRALNMSNCMIESLRSLSWNPLPAITVLNVRANRISSLIGFEKLRSLQRLDLRDNRMTDPIEIARLTGMPEFFDVYVKNNPFTVTHGSYRIILFNLFRAVPGNREDITIDAAGPTYSERRHLVERAAEAMGGHIVRPPFDDEGPQRAVFGETAPHSAFADTRDKEMLPSSKTGASKAAKKKRPKRRVVDLVEEQVSSKPPMAKDSSPGSPAKQSHIPHVPNGDRDVSSMWDDNSPIVKASDMALEQPEGSADLLLPGRPNEPSDPGKCAETVSRNSDLYKRRIEALKNDRGNAWLTAIESIGSKPDVKNEARKEPSGASHQFIPKPSPTVATSLEA